MAAVLENVLERILCCTQAVLPTGLHTRCRSMIPQMTRYHDNPVLFFCRDAWVCDGFVCRMLCSKYFPPVLQGGKIRKCFVSGHRIRVGIGMLQLVAAGLGHICCNFWQG